jgi:hypothetical protein
MSLHSLLGAVLDEATHRELPATVYAESPNLPSYLYFSCAWNAVNTDSASSFIANNTSHM